MARDTFSAPYDMVTHEILGAAFAVSKTLNVGFLEKVYVRALTHEMRKRGLRVATQVAIEVVYDSAIVGRYFADIIVNDAIVVEVKVARSVDAAHMAQCIHYLRATGLHICLLLNFGEFPLKYRRIVFDQLLEPRITATDEPQRLT